MKCRILSIVVSSVFIALPAFADNDPHDRQPGETKIKWAQRLENDPTATPGEVRRAQRAAEHEIWAKEQERLQGISPSTGNSGNSSSGSGGGNDTDRCPPSIC